MDIQFLLSVCGLSLIVTKSKLFKQLRIYFSSLLLANPKNKLFWFLDSVMSCYMCFSLWGGIFIYFIKIFLSNYYDGISLVLSSVIVTTLIIDLWLMIQRK